MVHAAVLRACIDMKVMIAARGGFTLVEMLIVVGIIGIVAQIVVISTAKARTASQSKGCVANLKQIEGAIALWAIENKVANGDPINDKQVRKYLRNKAQCPADGKYVYGNVGESPQVRCSKSGDGHSLP
jgi:prepilin-type N-terminal cleavage/methylation domain-containing protein